MKSNSDETTSLKSSDIEIFASEPQNYKKMVDNINIDDDFLILVEYLKENPQFFPILISLISYYYYTISLVGCPEESQVTCLNKEYFKIYYQAGYDLFKASVLHGVVLLFIMKKKIGYYFLIYLEIGQYFLFKLDNGVTLKNHGLYNKFFFFVLTPPVTLILFLLLKFYDLIKKKKYKLAGIITGIISIIFLYFYFFHFRSEGKIFYHGLKEMDIQESPKTDKCYFKKPSHNLIPFFDGIFDFSKFYFVTVKKKIPPIPYLINKYFDKENYCKIIKSGSKTKFKEFINVFDDDSDNENYIYPDTTSFSFYESMVGNFHYYLFDRIKKYTGEENRNPELIVKFNKTSDEGELTMNLKKDEKLLKKRKRIKKDVRFDNILFIFLDSVSKNHFRRKLPLTSKLIEKYINTNIENLKNSNEKINAFQFLKYNNFKSSTTINILPMFYGEPINKNEGISIIKYFKEQGYITGASENICHREMFLLEQGVENINYSNFDLENIAIFCDPNYNEPDNVAQLFRGEYSMLRRCLYGWETFDLVFEFGYQFLDKYENERKFLRLGFMEGHEGSMESIKYIDNSLYKFLLHFINKHFTEKSAIIIASDHGENMISVPYILSDPGFLYERSLGSLFLLLPNIKNNENMFDGYYNKEAIFINQNKFVTPFDIHDTLIYMMNLDKYSKYGQTLTEEINGLERNCKKYLEAFGDQETMDEFCRCVDY